jgi:quercetin dioxygenase-like cupin family protein
MKKVIFALAAVTALAAGAYAWATPPSGASGPLISRGAGVSQAFIVGTMQTTTLTRSVRVKVRGKTYVKRVKVSVPSVRRLIGCDSGTTCDTAFQQVTLQPGGSTGWHTHPGPTWVAVTQGEGTLYRSVGSACPATKYATGSGFLQPETEVHTLRNEGTTALVVHAYYIVPAGTSAATNYRVDQPQPAACPNIN